VKSSILCYSWSLTFQLLDRVFCYLGTHWISLLLLWKRFVLSCLPLWTLPTFFKNKGEIKNVKNVTKINQNAKNVFTSAVRGGRRGCVRLSGAQDFLPDYEQVPHWHSVYSVSPRYAPLFTAMRKAKEWMHNARVRTTIPRCDTTQDIYAPPPGKCWRVDRHDVADSRQAEFWQM